MAAGSTADRPATPPVPAHPDIPGIALTWLAARRDGSFWRAYDTQVAPILGTAQDAGTLVDVLAYEHRPVTVPGHDGPTWSVCVVAVGARAATLDELATELVGAAGRQLRSVDLLTLQPNLDMFHPVRQRTGRTRRMLQWIEYVVSDPARRDTYYPQQYVFSGPAMRRLHERGHCERFVGFEVTERRHGPVGEPAWDVLHISGFRPGQMFGMLPRFRSAAQAQAEAVYGAGSSARSILTGWDEVRTKEVVRARQRDSRFSSRRS
ncbi:hypothetical protein ACN27F_24870 [Solwaraspora sp. WMMB335]|uniref:hypothetical protein n=1 Tax=Solwaraspora sp. WMMB335 TaxID=3404118 RepID=UPI003B96594D